MKLIVHPDYSYLRTFVDSLPDTFEKEGETIYKVRNELKVFRVGDCLLNVKQYGIPPLFNRIAYTWFRKSKAQRAFENAVRIIELGFDTPTPVAYLECHQTGMLHRSYYVSLQCPFTHLFKEFAEGSSVDECKPVAEALGLYVARLHESGIYHKDLSGGNILFESDEMGVRFSLVDLNRMEFTTINREKGCENFNRLRGSEELFRFIASSYSRTRGFDEESCLNIIHKSQKKSIKRFKRKSTFKKWRRSLKQALRIGA